MKTNMTKYLAQAAVIAALYTVLTIALAPWSYGPIQVRVSEALTVLPLFMSSSIPGLFIGCLLANIIGGFGAADIIFGSLPTLIAAILTYLWRGKNKYLAILPPVVLNGLIVGAYVYILFDQTYPLPLTMLFVALGQSVAVYGLGSVVMYIFKKYKLDALR